MVEEMELRQETNTLNGSVGDKLESDPPGPAIFNTIKDETVSIDEDHNQPNSEVKPVKEEEKIDVKEIVETVESGMDKGISKETEELKTETKKKKGFIKRMFRR